MFEIPKFVLRFPDWFSGVWKSWSEWPIISNQIEVYFMILRHSQPIKLKNSFISIISSGDNVDKIIFQFDGLGMMDHVDFFPDK